jgi:iron-sulfur cluster repair protein YtfE (RIC family)
VRIDRAQPIPTEDLQAWLEEIERDFAQEIEVHFSAEESVLFPAAREFPEMVPLVEELIADHAGLRETFLQASTRGMSTQTLPIFARQLSVHIRKEERQLFQRLQQLMTPQQLLRLGVSLEEALKDATQWCALPNEATKLKPRI